MNKKFQKSIALLSSLMMSVSMIPPGSITHAETRDDYEFVTIGNNYQCSLVTGDFQFTVNYERIVFTEEVCGDHCKGHIITQSKNAYAGISSGILVKSGRHNVTFSDLNLTKISEVAVWSGATMNLTLEGANNIESTQCGIYVPAGANLVINAKSTDSLNVSSSGNGAGIGGAYYKPFGEKNELGDINCGTVVINGGNITASGADLSAGIGGAAGEDNGGNGGNITINGGKVNAKESNTNWGIVPGIGGANDAKSNGSLTISSPEVLDENTILGSKGTYYITITPTADMISVPTDLKYTSNDMAAEIEKSVSLSGSEIVCGQKFQVLTDGWKLNVDKVSVLEYTASYTHADKGTISKSVPIICGHDVSLEHHERKEAGCLEDGNSEYWNCLVCDKYFSDIGCTNEITFEDTVLSAKGHHDYSNGKCAQCGYEHGDEEHTAAVVSGKDATCLESGLTDGSCCSVCGKLLTEQEIIPGKVHEDKNNDGYCDNGCGLAMSEYGAVVKEVSATLDGNIGMNYYIILPKSVTDDNGSYVQFTANGKQTKVMLNNIAPEVDGTYKFTYGMNAKEMHDKVEFAVYGINGNRVELYDKAGNKVEGSGFEYSLAEYFNALSSDTSEENKALAELSKAALAYGSFAQKAFGYNIDTADSGIDISDVTVDVLENHRMTKANEMPEGLKLSEMTLILEAETTLCLYLKTDNMSKYSFALDGNAVVPIEIADEGLYCIKIADISAKELDTRHTLIINDNCTITFDALSYAYSVVKAGKNDSVCDVVKALYKYNEAANKYFND